MIFLILQSIIAIKWFSHGESCSAFSCQKMKPRTKEEGPEKAIFYTSWTLGLCLSPFQYKLTHLRKASLIYCGFEWLVISQNSGVLCPLPLSQSRE